RVLLCCFRVFDSTGATYFRMASAVKHAVDTSYSFDRVRYCRCDRQHAALLFEERVRNGALYRRRQPSPARTSTPGALTSAEAPRARSSAPSVPAIVQSGALTTRTPTGRRRWADPPGVP